MANVVFLENNLRIDKLGIMQLSSILRNHGHYVELLQDSVDDVDTYLENHNVDFIMFSIMTGEHLWFINKNKELKEKFKYKTIFGGPHPTFFPEQSENDNTVDFIVRGPGEKVINEIVNGKITSKIIIGELLNQEEINNLPFADRSILYKYDDFKNANIRRFIGSRDCKNSCAYCFNHVYHRLFKKEKCNFFIHMEPRKLIEEIKYVRNNFGCGTVYFNDDNLAEDKEWLKELCMIYKQEVGLPFCGSIRANNANIFVLRMLADAGCSFLNIALESSTTSVQKLLRRGKITNQMVFECNENCKQLGIKTRIQNMIGLPVENSLEDALQTFEYNKKMCPTDSWVSIFQPFPKTDIWKYCVENNFINENDECMNFYDDTILNIKDAEKINALHKWWHFGIKYNIPREFLELLLEIPLTNDQKKLIQDLRWRIASKELYGNR